MVVVEKEMIVIGNPSDGQRCHHENHDGRNRDFGPLGVLRQRCQSVGKPERKSLYAARRASIAEIVFT
jgi:hypothetical protein